MDADTLLAKARAYVDLAEAVDPVVREAAGQVIDIFKSLSDAEAEDISDLLTGKPVSDRARLEAAAVAGVVNASFDWAGLPDVAFQLARKGIELLGLGLALA